MNKQEMNAADIARAAKHASFALAAAPSNVRNNALLSVAAALRAKAGHIFAANEKDMEAAEKEGLSAPALKRLRFDEHKLNDVCLGLEQLAAMEDPIDKEQLRTELADGLVLSRAVEPGQVVGAGRAVLFRIAKGGEMEMLAKVDEADLARLSVGEPATVTPVGGVASYEGHIWQIAPVIDPQTRQGDARILIPYHRDVRPGGFAAARIVSGRADAPLLPESAIQNDDKGSYVYIVNAGNTVERRGVTIGQVSAAGVTVLSGLSGRERVVTLAGGFLNPGQKVIPELRKGARR